ncbi:hypothetical protein AA313_de0208226 [Arthrobotrys entomopaga]|nr:hypothetical protein AA313_de0208226 [Arthrobotrys entomopaga]
MQASDRVKAALEMKKIFLPRERETTQQLHPSFPTLMSQAAQKESLLCKQTIMVYTLRTLNFRSPQGAGDTIHPVTAVAMSNNATTTPSCGQVRYEEDADGCATPAYEDEIFPEGRDVDIFSPTVFDGFGLETPWADSDPDIDHYEWDT